MSYGGTDPTQGATGAGLGPGTATGVATGGDAPTGAGMAAGASADAPGHDPFLGTEVLGQYQVTAKIGQGGMGAVYRAHQPAVGRDVVIKVMHPWMSSNPTVAARFAAEARAVAQLQSPNIVSIFNFGQLPDGTLFLAMEYLRGRTLAEAVRHEGRLSLARAVSILEQCAAGLDEAHRKGVVHRDLKPSNIMIVPHAGGAELVKVLDFGIAKSADSGGLTRDGAMLGTPQYMAPEQVQGVKVDTRADVYALGLVAYELLSGRPAFSSETPIGYVHLHLNTEPLTFAQVAPEAGIPPAVEHCVRRALAKDPAQRTPSAAAFAAELRAALPGPVGLAVPRSANANASATLVAVGLGVALVVGGGTAAAFLLLSPDADDATPATVASAPAAEAAEEPGSPSPDPAPSTTRRRGAPSVAAPAGQGDEHVNLDGLTPEQRELYDKSVPELRVELRKLVVDLYGPQNAEMVLKQLEPILVTPKGVSPGPHLRVAFARLIVGLRDSRNVTTALIDPPEADLEALKATYLSMDCPVPVVQRRQVFAQLTTAGKGEVFDTAARANVQLMIDACETAAKAN